MEPLAVLARFQTPVADDHTRCDLCPRACVIAEGRAGFCGHRRRVGGRLIAAGYGLVAAAHLDPIEKKPLFHFHPGSFILSVGAGGCNLDCRFCQNSELARGKIVGDFITPAELAEAGGRGESIGVAFTYNEPTIWFEYILDTARLLRARGLKTVLVTNGYLQPDPWDELCRHIDVANIDVKGDDEFYRRMTGGALAPVRRNVAAAFDAGVHVEVTNLLVTDANDDPAQVRDLVDWLAGVSADIPLHLSRYHPSHQWTAPATPIAHLERALAIARDKLTFVYVGNAHLPGASDTLCPSCGATVIERLGYHVDVHQLGADGRCVSCGAGLPIVV